MSAGSYRGKNACDAEDYTCLFVCQRVLRDRLLRECVLPSEWRTKIRESQLQHLKHVKPLVQQIAARRIATCPSNCILSGMCEHTKLLRELLWLLPVGIGDQVTDGRCQVDVFGRLGRYTYERQLNGSGHDCQFCLSSWKTAPSPLSSNVQMMEIGNPSTCRSYFSISYCITRQGTLSVKHRLSVRPCAGHHIHPLRIA